MFRKCSIIECLWFLCICFLKVTLLLNPLMGKWWYTDLMTYLISLAMGTMLCVSVFQLIPGKYINSFTAGMKCFRNSYHYQSCNDFLGSKKTHQIHFSTFMRYFIVGVCVDAQIVGIYLRRNHWKRIATVVSYRQEKPSFGTVIYEVKLKSSHFIVYIQ